jgi:hypothetical protein
MAGSDDAGSDAAGSDAAGVEQAASAKDRMASGVTRKRVRDNNAIDLVSWVDNAR